MERDDMAVAHAPAGGGVRIACRNRQRPCVLASRCLNGDERVSTAGAAAITIIVIKDAGNLLVIDLTGALPAEGRADAEEVLLDRNAADYRAHDPVVAPPALRLEAQHELIARRHRRAVNDPDAA